MATTTPALFDLTPEEGMILFAAIQLLDTLDERLRQTSWDNDDSFVTSTLGMIRGVADCAGEALFHFVNTASSFGHSPVALEVIDKWIARAK